MKLKHRKQTISYLPKKRRIFDYIMLFSFIYFISRKLFLFLSILKKITQQDSERKFPLSKKNSASKQHHKIQLTNCIIAETNTEVSFVKRFVA